MKVKISQDIISNYSYNHKSLNEKIDKYIYEFDFKIILNNMLEIDYE